MAGTEFQNFPEFPSDDPNVLNRGDVLALERTGDMKNIKYEGLARNIRDTFDIRPYDAHQTESGTGNGTPVYNGNYFSYLGLIKLQDNQKKEYVHGRLVGARSSFARGGSIRFYAENDPYNNVGKDPSECRGFVEAMQGNVGNARLVQFEAEPRDWSQWSRYYQGDVVYDPSPNNLYVADEDIFTSGTRPSNSSKWSYYSDQNETWPWVAVEYIGGGSTINQQERLVVKTISDSGSDLHYPMGIRHWKIDQSTKQKFQGAIADKTVEARMQTHYDDPNAWAMRNVKSGTSPPNGSDGKNGDIYIEV
jgi:hypothetical protein